MSSKEKQTFEFLEANYTVEKDKDEGVLTITLDPAMYELNRPEDLTPDVEKKLDTYRQDFTANAITGAEGIVAAAMKKDKSLTTAVIKCDANAAYGFEATVQRKREGFNPKTREPLDTYGSTVVRVHTAYRKVGPIKKACASMADRVKAAVS
jgi:hypothetical protein